MYCYEYYLRKDIREFRRHLEQINEESLKQSDILDTNILEVYKTAQNLKEMKEDFFKTEFE